MKRLVIGIAAASLLSAVSLGAQADERGGRQSFSRANSHTPVYSRTERAAPRHYQPPRRHYAPPRHDCRYRPQARHGYRAHPGWGRHFGPPRGAFRYYGHPYRPWR